MSVHERILGLVDGFYAAALDDGRWPAVFAEVVAATGSRSCCAAVHDMRQRRFIAETMVNYDHLDVARMSAEYHAHYTGLDPQVHFATGAPGSQLFYDGLDPRFAPEANPRFARWEQSRIGRHYHLSGFGDVGRDIKIGLALDRTAEQGHATPAQIELMRLLWPHLERAWHVAVRLGTLEQLESLSLDRLAAERHGVLLLDRTGWLLFANPAAERMLAENDGLAARDGGVRVGLPETERVFRRMLAAAANRSVGGGDAAPTYLRVPRPSGRGRPYVLLVSPCPASERLFAGARAAALVLISDPERKHAPTARTVRAAFGLSEREAALAARLCLGDTLDEAARRLGMRRETARSHLAGAFAKTGTRRQHALVALLLAALAGID